MAKKAVAGCASCEKPYGDGRVLNAAEVASGRWLRYVSACRSCLTVTALHAEPMADRRYHFDTNVVSTEVLSSGGETARFLERIASASARGDLRSFHAAASTDPRDALRLRLPESLPFLRPMFVDGGEIVTDTFGVTDAWIGCIALEAMTLLPGRDTFRPDRTFPEERIVSEEMLGRGDGAFHPIFQRGYHVAPAVFRKEGRLPRAIERAICFIAPRPVPPPGSAFRLIAVPPDLVRPLA